MRWFAILQAFLLWNSTVRVSLVKGFSPFDSGRRSRRTPQSSSSFSIPHQELTQELDRIEEQSRRAALQQVDYNTVVRALDTRAERTRMDADNDSTKEWLASVWNEDDETSSLIQQQKYQQQNRQSITDVQVSLAASTVCSFLIWALVGHNPYVSAMVFGIVFYRASQDPIADDSVLGAAARLLGRQTVQSYKASEPKLRALARAVVTGEQEMEALQQDIRLLERRIWNLRQGRLDEDDFVEQNRILHGESFNSWREEKPKCFEEERGSMPPAWVRSNGNYNRPEHYGLAGALQSRGHDSASIFSAMEQYSSHYEARSQQSSSSWNVSMAAASVASVLASVVFPGNGILTGLVFGFVFFAALDDSTEDLSSRDYSHDPNEMNVAGTLARVVGYQTLQSYEASKPILKALASALVVEEEEIVRLQKLQSTLEKAHANLKEVCRTARDSESEYSYGYLKQVAYNNGLSIAGNKMQLLIRIMEQKILPVGKR